MDWSPAEQLKKDEKKNHKDFVSNAVKIRVSSATEEMQQQQQQQQQKGKEKMTSGNQHILESHEENWIIGLR